MVSLLASSDTAESSEFSHLTGKKMVRNRKTEMTSRSKFAEIFAPSDKDKLSSGEHGFNSQFFPMPCEEDADEEAVSPLLTKAERLDGLKRLDDLGLGKQESTDLRSPSPLKRNLRQITRLLDDDDDCFCIDNLQSLQMERQKSKTEYAKRPLIDVKASVLSAIPENCAEGTAGDTSTSQSVLQQDTTSPLLKVT